MRAHLRLWLAAAALLTLTGVLAPSSPLAQQSSRQALAERQALTAAVGIPDPAARLVALNKVRRDFPKGALLGSVDEEIFYLLVSRLPDHTKEIADTIDRMKSRVTANQPVGARVGAALDPATALIGAQIMLDRAEALLAEASSMAVFDTFAQEQRAAAEKGKQPAPADDALRTRFNEVVRMPLLEQQGRLQLAKGDLAASEAALKDALALRSPTAGAVSIADALGELAEAYDARGNAAHAEALLRETQQANPSRPRLIFVLAKYYAKHDEFAKARTLIEDRLKTATNFLPGELLLAELDAKHGDTTAGLARYLKLAASGGVRGADYDTMAGVYRKIHGSDAGLEAEIDRAYREQFPNPVKVERWTSPDGRPPRLVLAQLFTGSGCGPCVASDLAVDGLLERYPSDAVVPLLYHAHWPRPDPMTTSGGQALTSYYNVDGVPYFAIDGVTVVDEKGESLGGGPRAEAPKYYKEYVDAIDKALGRPPTAELSVRAQANGDQIEVSAVVSKLPAAAKKLRLQLVLAERELKFIGENGIRFHSMVVRGTVGPRAEGLPLSAAGTQKYTFNLAAIRDDIVKSLTRDVDTRRATMLSKYGTKFAAEGHAMTQIDVGRLVVVAYVQDALKHVLQTARTDVAAPAPLLNRR